ncbi:hypothetical protein BDQ17DRAFT_1340274 [Cyathus striatus]|nr:hypothetical protein BDQ17DRAFT_1340274 [Cyathus striatus]
MTIVAALYETNLSCALIKASPAFLGFLDREHIPILVPSYVAIYSQSTSMPRELFSSRLSTELLYADIFQ